MKLRYSGYVSRETIDNLLKALRIGDNVSHWIMVFAKTKLGQIKPEDVIAAVTESNTYTLCEQYGLDPTLIQPALEQIEVAVSVGGQQPLLALRYGPKQHPPVVVTAWDVVVETGSQLQAEMIKDCDSPVIARNLEETSFIYCVELVASQLGDMGLLLAYELARWIAQRGEGLVLGLDRTWYRLNAYQAFIPIVE